MCSGDGLNDSKLTKAGSKSHTGPTPNLMLINQLYSHLGTRAADAIWAIEPAHV
jgi:hypothetical protein